MQRLPVLGRGTAGVIIPSALEAGRFYAGTGAGVNISTDGGLTWRLPIASASPVLIEALVAAVFDDFKREVLYAGGSFGLSRSEDGGETWNHMLQTVHVRTLAMIPSADGSPDGQIILAGTDQDGVLRSDARGDVWSASNPGLLDRTVVSLATTLDDEGREIALAGTVSGIFLSRNAARAWRPVLIGEDGVHVECIAAVSRFNSGWTAYATSACRGLLRSDNGGLTWCSVSSFPRPSATLIAVVESIDSEPSLAVSVDEDVFLSKDGGETWNLVGSFMNPVMSLSALPGAKVSGAILAGPSDGGIVRFDPVSQRWSPSDTGLQAKI